MRVEATLGRPGPRAVDPSRGEMVARARSIAPLLAPGAQLLDREPDRLGDRYRTLRRFGYLTAPSPVVFGGLGATLSDVVRAQRTVAAACSNTALAVNMHLFQVGAMADRWRSHRGGEGLLRSVSDRGSILASTTGEAITLDPFRTSTILRPTSGGYAITGRKRFCSQARVMDLVRVIAQDETSGELVLIMIPASAVGLDIVEPALTMGMRGTQSFDVVLDNVVVTEEAITARLEGDRPLVDPALAGGAVWFMATIAGVYAGVADGARAEVRRLRRSDRPAGGRIELLHHRIDATIGHGLERLVAESDIDRSFGMAAAMKEETIGAAIELVDACVDAVGSIAYSSGSRLEQAVRDVRAGRHHPPSPATAMGLIEPDGLGPAIESHQPQNHDNQTQNRRNQ